MIVPPGTFRHGACTALGALDCSSAWDAPGTSTGVKYTIDAT